MSSDCAKWEEALSAFVDGQAEPAEAEGVALHLKECRVCARQVRWLKAAKASLQALPQPAMPADLKASLLRAARPKEPAPAAAWRRLREALRTPAGYGLTAAFAAACAVLVLDPRPSEELALDDALAAHDAYALTMPAASPETLYASLSEPMSEGDADEL